MNVPKDPIILASFINTKLRDEFQTLESACENLEIDKQELIEKMESVGLFYDKENNCFL